MQWPKKTLVPIKGTVRIQFPYPSVNSLKFLSANLKNAVNERNLIAKEAEIRTENNDQVGHPGLPHTVQIRLPTVRVHPFVAFPTTGTGLILILSSTRIVLHEIEITTTLLLNVLDLL